MNPNNPTKLKQAQHQLQTLQRQDKLLAQIETCFHNMKDLAHYAATHPLTRKETDQLNRQLEEQQRAIEQLKAMYQREQ